MSEKKSSDWKNPWVISFITIMVVLVATTAYRIMLGIETNPGLVTPDYYDRGQDFEENMLKKRAKQEGWTLRIDAPREVTQNKPSRFSFTLKNKEKQFVSADSVTVFAYRPSNVKDDFSVPMTEVVPGTYQADVTFPLKGAWDIVVSAKIGEEEYNQSHYVAAKPE